MCARRVGRVAALPCLRRARRAVATVQTDTAVDRLIKIDDSEMDSFLLSGAVESCLGQFPAVPVQLHPGGPAAVAIA